MDELTAFVTARLDEDEAAPDVHGDGCALHAWLRNDVPSACDCGYPARVLREVAAKRAILITHHLEVIRQPDTPFNPYTGEPNTPAYDGNCETCGWFDPNHGGCETVRDLTAVYGDHPDYRQEWKPLP